MICAGGRGSESHRGQRFFLFLHVGPFPFEGFPSGYIWDIYTALLPHLRAAANKYQKSLVSRDILDLLIFRLDDTFGELFLKIISESSADF